MNLAINSDLDGGKASYLNGKNVAIVAQTVKFGQLKTNGLSDYGIAGGGFRDHSEDTNADEQANPQVSISILNEAIEKSKFGTKFTNHLIVIF